MATPAEQLLLTWLIPLVRTTHGKCNPCVPLLRQHGHQWEKQCYCGMPDRFSLGLTFKKKKRYFISTLFDVSKYKKSQDSYTNYLQWDHAKQFKVYTTIIPPSLLLLYTTVWSTTENWMACAWLENFTCLQKTKPARNIQDSCYFVSASQFTNWILLRRHMGLEILAAQFYLITAQKARQSKHSVNFGALR